MMMLMMMMMIIASLHTRSCYAFLRMFAGHELFRKAPERNMLGCPFKSFFFPPCSQESSRVVKLNNDRRAILELGIVMHFISHF